MMSSNIPYELSDYVLGKYIRSVAERQGWQNLEAVIAAVSGGGDSIALLWMLRKFWGKRVVALHINHGIRGEESDSDEEFTAKFAEEIGANFVVEKVNVPSERSKGESLESAARRLRLSRICDVAKTLGISTVLTGHNRDDLAETVLFNILRGTGIRGSVGITEHSELQGVNFFRPLLKFRREFLREILRVRDISWHEDSTNNDKNYTRNYIRLKLLPTIAETINSSAVEHLAQFGEDMRAVREHEDEHSREILNACREDTCTLNCKKLRELSEHDISLVIRELGREMGLKTLSRGRCSELSGLIAKRSGFTFQWCEWLTVRGIRGKIHFQDKRGEMNHDAENS